MRLSLVNTLLITTVGFSPIPYGAFGYLHPLDFNPFGIIVTGNYLHPLDYFVPNQGSQYIHPLDRGVSPQVLSQSYIHPLDQNPAVENSFEAQSFNYIHPLDRGLQPPSSLPADQCQALGGNYAIPRCLPGTPPESCQGQCILPQPTPLATPLPADLTYEQCIAQGGNYAIPGCLAGTPPEQCRGRCFFPTGQPSPEPFFSPAPTISPMITPLMCREGQQEVCPQCIAGTPIERCICYCADVVFTPTPEPTPEITPEVTPTQSPESEPGFLDRLRASSRRGSERVYNFFVNLFN